MELLIASIVALISISAWILSDESTTQIEVHELSKLIDRLEQERELMKLFQQNTNLKLSPKQPSSLTR